MLAVGEDAHPDARARRLRLRQIVVQLQHIVGAGLEGTGGTHAALELDEGVESREVDGAAGPLGGWSFLDNLVAIGQPGEYQKVAHGAGDVGFGLSGVMPPQDLASG